MVLMLHEIQQPSHTCIPFLTHSGDRICQELPSTSDNISPVAPAREALKAQVLLSTNNATIIIDESLDSLGVGEGRVDRSPGLLHIEGVVNGDVVRAIACISREYR